MTAGAGKPRNGCRSCCCCCCAITFLLILLPFTAVAVFYFWFDPKPPTFDLKSMKVSQLSMTKNPDGTHLDVSTVATVEVKNPNGLLGINYGETTITLEGGKDGRINLGTGTAGGFQQEHGEVESLKLETGTGGELLDPSEEAEVTEGFKSGNLPVKVAVEASVEFVANGVGMGMIPVSLNCPATNLKNLEGGGTTPECTITIFRWFTIN